jgi:phosphoglycolate phosphatase-like HAD superfamily hydrolase
MQTTPSASEARISIQPGFTWDGQDAYLFDIDGTLTHSRDQVHHNAFAAGIKLATGRDISITGVNTFGKADTGILREAWQQAGLPAEAFEAQSEAILDAICHFVAEHRHEMDLVLMPGVEDVLAHLASKGARLGLATGNLERIAWVKMEETGLRKWFSFGGFSDQYPERAQLVGHGARVARELAGPEASVCVVGDTPRDIAAARANSLPVISVATGNFSFDELLAYRPEVCASSLADLLAQAAS